MKLNNQILLTISPKEAFFLKALLQNPHSDTDEAEEEAQMRRHIFEALPSFNVLSEMMCSEDENIQQLKYPIINRRLDYYTLCVTQALKNGKDVAYRAHIEPSFGASSGRLNFEAWSESVEESIDKLEEILWRVEAGRPPDWERVKWRQLAAGERIQEGEWVDMAHDGWRDDPQWVPATNIGDTAPDPAYPAHRIFRRVLKDND
jgi:hypothetical protein